MDYAALTTYLAELSQNNNKPWFEANRPRYDALRADFTDLVEEMIFGIAVFDRRIQGVQAKDSLFRIYRDVRFSKDKTPYKTTFSAAISEAGKTGPAPGYYFQISEEAKLMVGGGIWMPEPDVLARIRTYIATRSERLSAVIEDETFQQTLGKLEGESLQKPPRGFDENSPLIDFIKLKSFTAGRETPVQALNDDAPAYILDTFRAIYPLQNWLREAVGLKSDS